jgi:ankyrin repeat protein
MNDRRTYQINIEQRIRIDDFLFFQDLIETGINLNEIIDTNTFIHCATTNARILKLLLSHGGDPNVKNKSGVSPLFCALQYPDAIQILTLFNANINYQDPDGWTALYTAGIRGQYDAVKVLLSYGADPYIQTNDCKTILQTMKEYNRVECVQIIEEWLDIPIIYNSCFLLKLCFVNSFKCSSPSLYVCLMIF